MASATKVGWAGFLFSFDGRTTRSEYWLRFALPLFAASLAAALIDAFLTMGVLSGVLSLVAIWSSLALSVKRCHDRGRSGWFTLLAFLPFLNVWWLVEVAFLRGEVGPNRFGPDALT